MVRVSTSMAVLLLLSACGGGGSAPAPSVRANTEERKNRRDEIKALADVPADASKDVPTLLKAMNEHDPEVRWLAEFALGRVDDRGIKALTRALSDDSPKIRLAAAYVLGPMGKRARSALP